MRTEQEFYGGSKWQIEVEKVSCQPWIGYRVTQKGCDFKDDCTAFNQSCFKKKICVFRKFPPCIHVLFKGFIHLMQNVKTLNALDFRRIKSSLKSHFLGNLV